MLWGPSSSCGLSYAKLTPIVWADFPPILFAPQRNLILMSASSEYESFFPREVEQFLLQRSIGVDTSDKLISKSLVGTFKKVGASTVCWDLSF